MRQKPERASVVLFCPKCGTKAPDDESAFCNKCGTRLPPVVPEKTDIICPRCRTKFTDEQSVFCNRCGSPLQRIPAGTRQAAAPPVMTTVHCPSCGAPLVDDISEYCNVCGAEIHGAAPLHPVPVPARPSEKTVPAIPAADSPDSDHDGPVKETSQKPFLKWGIIAMTALIVLVAAAAIIPGMIPGTNQSASAPVPATGDTSPVTTVPTRIMTRTTVPVTPAPSTIKTTAVPVTTVKKNTTTTVTANASANVTVNATRTTPTPAITNLSRTLAIGEGASDGKGKLTVDSIMFKDKMGDPTPSYAIGKKYLIVGITYENLQQNETTEVNVNGMIVKDGGGYTFDQVSDVTLENPFNFIGKTVPPGEKRTGNMLYIVPPGATLLTFQYDFGNQNIAKFQLS